MSFALSQLSSALGGSSGGAIGSIVQGQYSADPAYLLCDGSEYTSATYPSLDKTGLATLGSNSWTTRSNGGISASWSAIAYGAGLFVAVSTDGKCVTSPDGINWTQRTIENNAYRNIIYAGGKFLATSTTRCAYSTDGITWAASTISVGLSQWYWVAYGNGMFVITSELESTASFATSPDGITWTQRANPNNLSLAFGPVAFLNGEFYATIQAYASSPTSIFMKSTDGINWGISSVMIASSGTYVQNTYYMTPVAIGNRIYFSNGSSNYFLMSEDSGQSFNYKQTQMLTSQSYINCNGILIGCRSTTDSYCSISYDGMRSFRSKQMPVSAYWGTYYYSCSNIAYGNNRIVAVPQNATTFASIDVDTTKFRTPFLCTAQDQTKYFMKVA